MTALDATRFNTSFLQDPLFPFQSDQYLCRQQLCAVSYSSWLSFTPASSRSDPQPWMNVFPEAPSRA